MANKQAQRDSNLELMRIVLMFFIITHHFVVNSGVLGLIAPTDLSANAVFIRLWGMWGKTAINSFVLITGWFMCTSRLTWKKYVRLLAQIYFWKILIWIVFAVAGMPGITPYELYKNATMPFWSVDDGFVASFLAMYLTIPFLNRLLTTLDKGAHLRLLALLLGIHTVLTTFLFSPSAFSEYGWYCTLYLLAAYLRTYAPAWTENRRLVSGLTFASIALSMLSVVVYMLLNYRAGAAAHNPYFLVMDSGKLLALTTGVLVFLWFKGLKLPYNKAINTVSATVFGVLLIHTHSDLMRAWLWGRGGVFDVQTAFESFGLAHLALWSLFAAVSVFAVCSVLDWLRIRFVEPHFLAWLDAHGDAIETRVRSVTDAVAAWIG